MDDREILIVYLGPSCPSCQRWTRVLNVVHQVPELPTVVGVVAVDEAGRAEFVGSHDLRFPVHTIPKSLMNRLADAVPTTVHIREGRIHGKWVGQMPDGFMRRFKAALFPAVHASE